MLIKKTSIIIIIIVLIMSLLTGCSNKDKLDPKNPVTLNLWHNYGGQIKQTMDDLIDEFNETVGKENGIIINVTSISSSSAIHDKLVMAANEEPNAPKLPDITTIYPNTALILYNKGLLADFDSLFSKTELDGYIPQFLEEGRLTDGKLYVFPTAKSTEVIFINTTIFNRFMREKDVNYDDLKTFEGIIKTAKKYYEWTDEETPSIDNDGKTFLSFDSLFNAAQICYEQLDDSFILNNKLNLSSNSFNKIWDLYYESAVKGYFAIYDGYGSDLVKTGNVVASIGSTAGVLFYAPTVTYADNTSESAEYMIMPYPTVEGGKKVAIQRGGGMCIVKSDEVKEYAAGIFLKWFTQPEQNIRFISSTGYLPVTNKALDLIMSDSYTSENANIEMLLLAVKEMLDEYNFYIPPTIDNFDELQSSYNNNIKNAALHSKEEYVNLLKTMDSDSAYAQVKNNKFEDFIDSME